MGKSIKKIYKISIIFLLVIIAIPTVAYFILKSSKVQTYLTQQIAQEVSENLNAKFEVESVDFRFFNRVVLKNAYIADQLKDTLFFSKEIICNLKKIDRKQQIIDISNVNLIDAKFYLHLFDTLQPINLAFITNPSQGKDTVSSDKPKWQITFRNIELHQTVFRFKSVRKKERSYGVNFNDLVCNIDDFEIRNLEIKNGIVEFYVKKLKFKEKSGFYVYNMKFNFSIGPRHMVLKNVKIRSPYSYINSDSLSFRHNNWDEFREFAKNIRLDFALQESNVSFKDIGYFAPTFKNIPLNIVISGRVYSKLSTFKGKNVKFHVGEQTELITDFNLNGLPDHRQMFMYVDFKKLTTWAKDFELINKFLKPENKIVIPENFEKLGIISYRGNFAGFYDDFVTYGKFTTDLGNISTDLSLQPDTLKTLNFNGKLKTRDFQIGELVSDNDIIGKLSMDAQIKGTTSADKTLKAKTEGVVHSIEINNYNYQNINYDGYLTEKTYDGILSITDPNIQLNFSGGIDFSKEIPVFNFYANVPKANLHGLNIDKKDSTAQLSFDLAANFTGIDIDNADGEINFTNTKLLKFNEEMAFDTLKLISEQYADTHHIELKSDYIDALILGTYKSTSLIQSIKNLYYNYFPALIKNPTDTLSNIYNNNFSLNLDLKNTTKISKFFMPYLILSDSSSFYFNYNAGPKRFLLNARFDELRYKNHTFNNLSANTFSNDSIFTAVTKCSSLLLNNYFSLENFKSTSISHNNNINLKIDWNNSDTINYEGKILASTAIQQKHPYGDPSFSITVLPSQIIVKDSLWHINKSIINIDSTAYTINNFLINHGNQYFNINGKISENQDDTLFFELGKLNLAHLNIITKEKKLEFEGNINGTANFSNIYDSPLFFSNIEIDNLTLNKEEFGFTRILSHWIDNQKVIKLDLSTLAGNNQTIYSTGVYSPVDKNIDFNITLNKLGFRVLSPYLSGFASKINGLTYGDVKVTGTLDQPNFNGLLSVENVQMTIDYIKTPYHFSTKAKVENNSIIFSNIDVKDTYGNIGLTNGHIKFGPDKNISFNFNIDANKVHSLNTTGMDNDAFYGTAFMSGIINIIGDRGNTFLDISARTEKNTKINIPLTRFQSADESRFISFANNKKEQKNIKPIDYNIDFSGFELNFDLEVTPDAETQLIFDSKIGDVIRGKGEGNLKMEIDDKNQFNMFGEYIIEEGEYLFTLQNVINKKFEIERGGNILWSGEPYDANIDIEAVYNLKTALTGLIDSSYYNTNDYYKKRIPIECQIFLTDKLMNPNIRFDIDLPTADEETKTLVRTVINTEEKLNKQFLSLLVLNSFLPEQSGTDSYLTTTTSTVGLGTVTTSELLSNQLSHWLSQISDEWDIGVNYRPGDEISKDQVEVALSTQLLNDRVSINGNVGYGGQTVEQASNIVGDVNIDVKLNKSGKLRFKAFNESNDKLMYEEAPYTQGVGIFYREEFNTFSELMRRYWYKISKKKKEETTD